MSNTEVTVNEPEPTGWFTEQRRALIYRALLAAITLASIYGLIGDKEVVGWTGLVTAVVGNGLATLNTDRSKSMLVADQSAYITLRIEQLDERIDELLAQRGYTPRPEGVEELAPPPPTP